MEQSREANHNGNHYATEDIAALKTPLAARTAPFWRVWTCIDALLAEYNPTSKGNGSDGSTTKHDTTNVMMQEPYRSTTIQVAWILRKWALKWAGQESWTSVLNKRKLQHEVEESIVAIYHLHQWMMMNSSKTTELSGSSSKTMTLMSAPQEKPFVVVDVCGGKGLFSMLLSYVASEFWYAPPPSSSTTTTSIRLSWRLQKIVLLERAKNVDWSYIHESNERVDKQPNNNHNGTNTGFIPRIEIWANTNLHDTDVLLTKFESLCTMNSDLDDGKIIVPLALSGIHLCKLLSPSLINLANRLGAAKNPYLCLAPCCMPRMVLTRTSTSSIPIQLYETPHDRQDRLNHNQEKASRRGKTCFLCLGKDHWVRQCPQMKGKSRTEQDAIVAHAVDNTPCWNCGVVGHFKPECPLSSISIDMKRSPPTMEMDVSEIMTAKTDKYERYCTLLAQYLEMSSGEQIICQPTMNNNSTERVATGHDEPLAKKPKISNSNGSFKARVVESGLTTVGDTHQQDGNWNSRRKSIFIVANR